MVTKSFNGAATFQLRIVTPAFNVSQFNLMLQWSRNFSVADCRPRPRCHLLRKLSFNGAATFQLRIALPILWADPRYSASMEPQLFSCGLKEDHGRSQKNHNEASMEPQLFSCGLHGEAEAAAASQLCFNGAATFQLRIAVKVNRIT